MPTVPSPSACAAGPAHPAQTETPSPLQVGGEEGRGTGQDVMGCTTGKVPAVQLGGPSTGVTV